MDRLFELMCHFMEGRYSINTISSGEACFVELSDSLVDCTPNEYGMESWFDVLKNYVPGTFMEELAKRLMALYIVDVSVVDGPKPGLLFRKDTP